MAARPGEDLAATLFADIHYYYGPPTAKPSHHRFDKESYVYLFENASQRRARVEIANSAGTPDQDAFNGFLDGTHMNYSYRHPSLLTLVVDGLQNKPGQVNLEEWHLPSFDPKNETKYLYRLHTIDIYFWTKEDAQKFLGAVRRVLPAEQITILDEPAHDEMSPLVQNLEKVAITHVDTRHSRGASISSSIVAAPVTAAPPPGQAAVSGLPPPPPNFTPMAYNPAAPAAPEAITHREKTPPPEDGAANPLVAAATADQGQAFGGLYQGGFSGPPPSALSPQQPTFFSGPLSSTQLPTSPPPQVQSPFAQHFQNHFAPPPTSATVPPPQAPPAYQAQSPTQPVPAQSFTSFPLGTASTSAEMYNPGLVPAGGYAQYDYNPGLSNTRPMMTDYSIHSEVYRPTEGESTVKTKKMKAPAGKFEDRAGRVEKGVNGFLKKLEKRVG